MFLNRQYIFMMDKCPAIKKKVLRKFRVIKYQNEVSNNNQQVTLYSYVLAGISHYHYFVERFMSCSEPLLTTQLQKKFIRIVRPLTILSRSENELKSESLSFCETTSVVANGKQLVKKYTRQTLDGEEVII